MGFLFGGAPKLWAILFILMVASSGAWAQAPTYLQGANQPGALAVPNATVNTDSVGKAVMVPFGQSQGTTTNDNAAAGKLGEYVSSTIAVGSPIPLTNNTPANITSIQLTAGDWDVSANAGFHPAGSTTITQVVSQISTTSATMGLAADISGTIFLPMATVTGVDVMVPLGTKRLSLGTTTTVYLVGQSSFGVSTMGGYGTLQARRVR